MAYDTLATGRTPALIIYLIDISGSMSESLNGMPKIDHVNSALEALLMRLVSLSSRGEVISPRYNVSMIAYSDSSIDIFQGVKSIEKIVQIGKPTLSTTNSTNTAAAFEQARTVLREELSRSEGRGRFPAPMVCHLTDGHYTGADPEPIAKEIMAMETSDGRVLVENIYVGPNLTVDRLPAAEQWPGLFDASALKDPYAKKLFEMSSALPGTYVKAINSHGYRLERGARMLIPSTSPELIELAFVMSGSTPTG